MLLRLFYYFIQIFVCTLQNCFVMQKHPQIQVYVLVNVIGYLEHDKIYIEMVGQFLFCFSSLLFIYIYKFPIKAFQTYVHLKTVIFYLSKLI